MKIAVLALQGAFAEHEQMLARLGVKAIEIRQKKDLSEEFDGIIIPGGESTVIGKLLTEEEMLEPLSEKILNGLPVFGTCAGLILLAKQIKGEQGYLRTMNIVVQRNAYGRQLGSFSTESQFRGIGLLPMVFIRAPYIESVSDGTMELAAVDGKIVAAREGNQLVTAFHPELTDDLSIHQYFLTMVQEYRNETK